jgi:hypothetical protein
MYAIIRSCRHKRQKFLWIGFGKPLEFFYELGLISKGFFANEQKNYLDAICLDYPRNALNKKNLAYSREAPNTERYEAAL